MGFLDECDRFFKDMFTDLGKFCLWILSAVWGIVAVIWEMFLVTATYAFQLFLIAIPIAIVIWFVKLLL